MNEKKKEPTSMGRKLIQNIINKEREGWPPDTPWGVYQPRRPELNLLKPDVQNKK